MKLELTKKQQEGLEIAIDKYNRGASYCVIGGFAGTGKTTLVHHIIAALGVSENDVVYCAYTGKATQVLASKGCRNTSTLHRLLYHARQNHLTGKFYFHPRSSLERDYKIVVIDEVSMLPKDMWDLMVSHDTFVLALGDPGQLGPVKADQDSGLLKHPDIFLTEIMRQAEGNEIIRTSMNIRKGMSLTPFQGEQVQILTNDKFSTGMMQWADIILCAKNDTRHKLNAHMRELEDRGEEPEVGDKIICLRNYWEVISDGSPEEASPLVNGSLGFITSVEKQEHRILKIPILKMSIETELGEKYSNLIVDYNLLMTGKPALTYKQYRERTRSYAKGQVPMPMEFAFGYAITTWKAQGSEWDKVLLIEENFPWEKEEKKRYLYTGVTRASEKLVVIKK